MPWRCLLGGGELVKSKVITAIECLQYALSLPVSVVITGCDSMTVLEQALSVARAFKPLDEAGRRTLETRVAGVAKDGTYELYKTSHHFDGTHKHPAWLES